ncbi:MAG: hypothetical protein HQL75_12810 [Magnetococcales bacterium]|nr:hypothetical protein [Magnetococcales bacterium]
MFAGKNSRLVLGWGDLPWGWVALVIFSLLALAACGGGDSGDTTTSQGTTESSSSGARSIVTTTVAPGVISAALGSHADIVFTSQGRQTLSDVMTFDSGAMAALGMNRALARANGEPLSFVLHLTGADVGDGGVSFQSVTNPKGESLDMGIQPCVPHYCSVLVPRTPTMTDIQGTWQYRLRNAGTRAKDFSVYITLRSGPTPGAATKLIVAPYQVAGTSFTAADVTAAMTHLVSIFAKNDIAVEVRNLTTIEGAQFKVIDLDFTNTVVVDLVSRGAADAVNIFFVEDFLDYGALGIAAAVPGSMGLSGGHNGILIGMAPHAVGSVLDTDFMGETAAHEMGHFFGLFHTSEYDGSSHDPLADTPECPMLRDVSGSGSLEVEECSGLGADNLMFWTPFNSWAGIHPVQDVLTQDQRTLLRYAPIAQ